MALQKNIKLAVNFGIEVEIPNAYIKVKNVDCSKEKTTYTVSIKKSNDGMLVHNVYGNFNYDINGENPIKQAYLHIKTLPEFAGAIDC